MAALLRCRDILLNPHEKMDNEKLYFFCFVLFFNKKHYIQK